MMVHDSDRFASLFTQDGAWRIPYVNAELVSREEIRAGIERMPRWRARRPTQVNPVRPSDPSAYARYL